MTQGTGSLAYWSLTAVMLAVVLFLMAIPHLSDNVWNTQGKGADKKTARLLARFAMTRGGKVLRNITIAHGGKTAAFESMLVLPSGIVIADTLGGKGSYYGDVASDKWVRTLGEERFGIQNPLKRQDEAVSVLRAYFAANKVYNIKVDCIVVYTNRSKDTKVFVDGLGKQEENKVIPLKQVNRFLQRDRFEADNGVGVAALASFLSTGEKA